MAKLRIDVGAALDGSVTTAFTAIEKAAVRAASIIRKTFQDAGASAGKAAQGAASKSEGPYRTVGKAAGDAATKVKKAGQEMGQALGQVATGADQKFKALAAGLKGLPVDLRTVAREASKALQQIEREKARAALGLGSGASKNSLYWHPSANIKIRKPTIHTLDINPLRSARGFGMGAASFARRAMTSLAASAGVETDWQALAGRNVKDETVAQQISNSGYMPGMAGPNGQIVGRQDILSQARGVAIDTGTERGDILSGLQAFVGKTGDLALGRDILKDMAVLAKATGASFADMSNASAEVSNVLGDIPNKAGVTQKIMKEIAGQGKLGAVEVRDLAVQMAKIATQSTKFQGGAEENIGLLGVVAQEAKARGGATNAAQATTAVARFAEEFSKPTVLKHLTKSGLHPYADAGHTQLKKAPELISEILSYTKGDLTKLSAVMPSTIAQKAIGGFAQVYNETSGDDAAKIRAVIAEFDRLKQAQLTQVEVDRAFSESMKTSEAASNVFNERMADVVEHLQGTLMPALVALSPLFVDLATGAASFLGKLIGADYGADDDAKRRRKDKDAAAALEKELLNASPRTLKKGEPTAVQNAKGEWVANTGMTVERGHYEDVANRSVLVDKAASAEEADVARLKGRLKGDNYLSESYGNPLAAQKMRENDTKELNIKSAHLEELRDISAGQKRVLEEIRDALNSGKITLTAPTGTPKPPGDPPEGGGAAPAGSE